jgi:uncharacterized membrane protein
MTAEQKYSPSAQAVINDYLDRLKYRLAGFPPVDREDLLREIGGHIDEAFAVETGGDEIERLLRVLRRLGEPADVISERMSPAMVKLGKKKGLPFYILSGILIALFGLPLGVGAVGVLIGVLAAILGLLVAYFAAALSLLVSGVIGMIVSVILMMDPTIIERINLAFGGRENIHLIFPNGLLHLPPQTEAFISLILCIILAGLGALMLWGGRYLLRGIGYLFKISWEKMQETFDRRRQPPVAGRSSWIASVCRS